MRIQVLTKLPRSLVVAFSGGVDSVAAAHFLSRNHQVTLAYFHHRTEHGEKSLGWIEKWAKKYNLQLVVGYLNDVKDPKHSPEEHWRIHRYKFLENLQPTTVVTCHHLDDCIETFLWSSLHGNAKTIPLCRNNIVRPFLTTPKINFIDWCKDHNLDWIEDPSNDDLKYTRNYIRHELIPHALKVNPGLATVVRKKILSSL